MSEYIIYYTEASIVCLIIFSIMLFRDLFSVDRQEKQLKYDNALIAFMLYFISDALWAGIIAGVLPATRLTAAATNFSNYVLMAAITYNWLRYVMAVEQVPHRNSRRTALSMRLPFYVVTLALIATYILAPQVLMNDALEIRPAYSAFQITVPCIYIAAVVGYTLKRAKEEENPMERRRHLYVGLFPLLVVVGGLAQIILLPNTPLFCFCCTILMLVFYINDMEMQISTDPLTALNNRGQLLRYISQASNQRSEGRKTCVVMLDIDDFKGINDTYGHAEGDHALVIVADALKNVVRNHSISMFLARYGGDEFTIILHPNGAEDVEALICEIREQVEARCRAEEAPYFIGISAGYDQLSDAGDTVQKCMQRADQNLYQDKARRKRDAERGRMNRGVA